MQLISLPNPFTHGTQFDCCKMETIDDSTTPPTKERGMQFETLHYSVGKSRRGLIYVPKQLPFGTVPAAWLHLSLINETFNLTSPSSFLCNKFRNPNFQTPMENMEPHQRPPRAVYRRTQPLCAIWLSWRRSPGCRRQLPLPSASSRPNRGRCGV